MWANLGEYTLGLLVPVHGVLSLSFCAPAPGKKPGSWACSFANRQRRFERKMHETQLCCTSWLGEAREASHPTPRFARPNPAPRVFGSGMMLTTIFKLLLPLLFDGYSTSERTTFQGTEISTASLRRVSEEMELVIDDYEATRLLEYRKGTRY